ncbi:MAG TPA: hypothetical protein VF471_07605 [Pseudoxanthomonas sp.]
MSNEKNNNKDIEASGRPTHSKTPMFAAVHAIRYQRQQLIREIQDETKTAVLCYVGGAATSVGRDDAVFFGDLLHNVARGKPIDLLLHTGGGDIDAAEKLMSMLSDAAGTAPLRVIIPDYAKSAGTLMALGADSIMMSDSSELGPIDPQIETQDSEGRISVVAVQNHLDAYKEAFELVKREPDNKAAQIMLRTFDASRIHKYRAAQARARQLAEKMLKSRMFRDDPFLPTAPVNALMDNTKYQSHGQMIGINEAKEISLKVEARPPDDPLWRKIWQLYCYQRMGITDEIKLFESEVASLPI